MEEYVWVSGLAHRPAVVTWSHPTLHRLARQHDVKMTIAGPHDAAAEPYVQAVYDAIERRAAGIMVMGWGDEGVVPAIDAALDSGIPVITVDSDVPSSRRLAHVGADRFRMGGAMADRLAQLMGGRGKALMIGSRGVADAESGFRGFQDRMAAYPDIQMLGPEDDLDVEPDKARAVVTRCLAQHPDLTGVAGFDENSGPGAALALAEAGVGQSVKLVCVEADAPHVAHIRAGTIDAAYCQKRAASAYLAFQMLYAYNNGCAATGGPPGPINIPGSIDTGHIVVTRENLGSLEEELGLDEVFERDEVARRLALASNLMENSAALALAADANGRILYANPASVRTMGLDEAEILDSSVDAVFDFTDTQRARVTQAIAQGKSCSLETRARTADGPALPVQLCVSPWKTDATVRGAVLIATDIAARKQAEEAWRQGAKMQAIGRFAGGMAHDFNDLLTAVMGYSDLALSRLDEHHPVRGYIEEIARASENAASLTARILAFSRRQMLEPKAMDLHAVVADLEKPLRRMIGRRIRLEWRLAHEPGIVRLDRAQLEQAIANLVTNARDAMPQGGRLTIETANVVLDQAFADTHAGVTPGPHVMLAVSDTGCGMDKATRQRVFEPLFTTKKGGQGTGLGLATVYGVVTQHGGHICVCSEPRRGTTFTIHLPRADAEIQDAAREAEATS